MFRSALRNARNALQPLATGARASAACIERRALATLCASGGADLAAVGRVSPVAADSGVIRATRRAQRRERPALDARGRGPRAGGEGLERVTRAAEGGTEHRGKSRRSGGTARSIKCAGGGCHALRNILENRRNQSNHSAGVR